MKPVVLSVAHLPDFLTDRLRQAFDFRDRVHEQDPAAFDAIAPRVRGIVASGEARVTRELLARLPEAEIVANLTAHFAGKPVPTPIPR